MDNKSAGGECKNKCILQAGHLLEPHTQHLNITLHASLPTYHVHCSSAEPGGRWRLLCISCKDLCWSISFSAPSSSRRVSILQMGLHCSVTELGQFAELLYDTKICAVLYFHWLPARLHLASQGCFSVLVGKLEPGEHKSQAPRAATAGQKDLHIYTANTGASGSVEQHTPAKLRPPSAPTTKV